MNFSICYAIFDSLPIGLKMNDCFHFSSSTTHSKIWIWLNFDLIWLILVGIKLNEWFSASLPGARNSQQYLGCYWQYGIENQAKKSAKKLFLQFCGKIQKFVHWDSQLLSPTLTICVKTKKESVVFRTLKPQKLYSFKTFWSAFKIFRPTFPSPRLKKLNHWEDDFNRDYDMFFQKRCVIKMKKYSTTSQNSLLVNKARNNYKMARAKPGRNFDKMWF